MDGSYDDCEHGQCIRCAAYALDDRIGTAAYDIDSRRHRRIADRRREGGVQHTHSPRSATGECAEQFGHVRVDRSCGYGVAASSHQGGVGEVDHDAMDADERARLLRRTVRSPTYDDARSGAEFTSRRSVRDGSEMELFRHQLSRMGRQREAVVELREGIQFDLQHRTAARASRESMGAVRIRTAGVVRPDTADSTIVDAALPTADDARISAADGAAARIPIDAIQHNAGAARRNNHTEETTMKIATQ